MNFHFGILSPGDGYQPNDDSSKLTYDDIEKEQWFSFPDKRIRNLALSHIQLFVRKFAVEANLQSLFQIFINLLSTDVGAKNPLRTMEVLAYYQLAGINGLLDHRYYPYILSTIESGNISSKSIQYIRSEIRAHYYLLFNKLTGALDLPNEDDLEDYVSTMMEMASLTKKKRRQLYSRLKTVKETGIVHFDIKLLTIEDIPKVWLEGDILACNGWVVRQIRGLDFGRLGVRYSNCLKGLKKVFAANDMGIYFTVTNPIKDELVGFLSWEENVLTFWDRDNLSQVGSLTDAIFADVITFAKSTKNPLDPEHQSRLDKLREQDFLETIGDNKNHMSSLGVIQNFLVEQAE